MNERAGARAALAAGVELLERALGYTRVLLADVRPELLDHPTPCRHWDLRALLAHMEDALDAFTEAARGYVDVAAAPPTATRVDALREKACALLGAWSAAEPAPLGAGVEVGDAELAAPLLVAIAALEITVHGWDVGQATGRATAIPDELAAGLLPVAHVVVHHHDRDLRFARSWPVGADAPAHERLLAHLGRPPDWSTASKPAERASRPGVAS